MKIISTIIIFFFASQVFSQVDTLGPLDRNIINAVVEIKNGNELGTGFLIYAGKRVFLITNKHMIGDWNPYDGLYNISTSIDIVFYGKDGKDSNQITPITVEYPISKNNQLVSAVFLHPQKEIDITALEVTQIVSELPVDRTNYLDSNILVSLYKAEKVESYGSRLFTIGYPSGITSYNSNQPIVKSGSISSSLDGQLVLEENWQTKDGTTKKVFLNAKVFLVDGAVVPGNSGGPVVTSKELTWRYINGQGARWFNYLSNVILGIVSHTLGNSNISVIYSSDYVLDILRSRPS